MDRIPRRGASKGISSSLERRVSLLTILTIIQLLILLLMIFVVLKPGFNKLSRLSSARSHIQEPVVTEQDRSGTAARTRADDAVPVVSLPESGDLPPEVALDRPVYLEILNGCAVRQLAARFGEKLRDEGYDIRDMRNAARSNYPLSYIYDRTGIPGQAEQLAKLLGIPMERVILDPDPSLVDVDLSLILGADYTGLNIQL